MNVQRMLLHFGPAFAGATSAAVDLYFTSIRKDLIIAILSLVLAMTYQAKYYLPVVFRYYDLVIWANSVTELVGTTYALKIFLQIWRYVRGYDTDDIFLELTTVAEYDLILYFFSNGTIRILWLLWHFRGPAAMIAISVGFVWQVLPENAKVWVVLRILTTLILGWKSINLERCSVRGLFLTSYEPMMNMWSRLEKASIQEEQKASRCREKAVIQEEQIGAVYVYTHLRGAPERTIRLLRLESRIRFSELTCSLSACQLDKAPAYEAVSYTWGDLPPKIPLRVDGESLHITSSVEKFLWHSRSCVEPKYFWIDAICINQKDCKEKESQILLMQDIYARATRVIVWLDAPTSPTYINDLRFALRFLANEALTGFDTMTVFRKHFGSERENAPFQALRRFFSHPWFERIWVIQEVAMGRVVHVKHGGMCINWPCVERAAQSIMSNRVVYGYLAPSALAFYQMNAKPTEGMTDDINSILLPNVFVMSALRSRVLNKVPTSLARVLYITRSAFKATKQKDKIFAVLGISTASELPFIPKYSETTKEIFTEITRILLREPDWHLILSSAGRGYSPGKLASSLPSWVPDYGGPSYSDSGFASSRGPREDAPSSDPEGGVEITSNEHISVQCVKFDVLTHIGPDAILENPTRATYHALSTAIEANDREMCRILLHGKVSTWYISSRALAREHSAAAKTSQAFSDEEFWATCMSESVDKSPEYLKTSKEAWEQFFVCGFDEFLEMSVRMEKGWIAKVMRGNFSRTVTGKAFAITSKGRMALVPPGVKVGDLCVWIRGALLPFVLRNGTEGRFEIVGTCYVHGVEDVYTEEEKKWEKCLLE